MPEPLLVTLLSLSLNLTRLTLGSACQPTDQTFTWVLQNNQLQWLQKVTNSHLIKISLRLHILCCVQVDIRQSSSLTLETVASLLLHCDRLSSLLDLSGWERVSPGELAELQVTNTHSSVNIYRDTLGRNTCAPATRRWCWGRRRSATGGPSVSTRSARRPSNRGD